MEELWIFYSLAGLLVLWLWDFVKKTILQKWWSKEVFLFLCFVVYMLLLWWNYFINSDSEFTNKEITSAIITGSFDFIAPLWMLTALKYLEISFTLVSIRLISSIFILIIWMNVLWDQLSIGNIFGFLIWFVAIFLLSGFTFWKKITLHTKGMIGLVLSIIGTTWSHSYFKYVVSDVNIDNFLIIKFSVTFWLIIAYMLIRKKFREFNSNQLKLLLPYAVTIWTLFVVQFLYLLPNIYLLGPLSLSYKILSYSLIVPIILSAIIYKDKITKRKALAFALTLISLALFII